ncbi:MAG: ATP-binding protein [Planctomycetota bacterium]
MAPPPIYITRIQLAGEDSCTARDRHRRARRRDLAVAPRNSVAIQFAGVSFRGEHQLYYQYWPASVDAAWSPRTTQRSVHCAWRPATTRSSVRAVHASGVSSPAAAAFASGILPPITALVVSVAAAATALAGLGVARGRLRVQRIVALESIRRQIATDIHDDLGSDRADRDPGRGGEARHDAGHAHLPRAGGAVARSMRESMSDISSSVDPRRSLRGSRAAHAAGGLQPVRERGCARRLHVPRDESFDRTGLPPDRRRHLFLIFKEALANAARHAHAGHVTIELALDRTTLRLCVHDDGCGFDADAVPQGHGMQNLRSAAALGGRLQIHSTGAGTTVELSMPL